MQEYFRQPIVDTFDIRICMSKSIKHSVDFLNDKESDLHEIGMTYFINKIQSIAIPFLFTMISGLAAQIVNHHLLYQLMKPIHIHIANDCCCWFALFILIFVTDFDFEFSLQ